MRFTNLAVLAAVAPAASAFMPVLNQYAFTQRISTTSGTTSLSLSVDGFSTSDNDYASFTNKGKNAKFEKAKAKPAPKVAAPKVVAEKKEKVIKEKPVRVKKEKAPPKPKAASYQLDVPKAKAKAQPANKKPSAAVSAVAKPPSDPSTLYKGVALGAAPVVLLPVAALAVGRSFLTNTAARRQAIQEASQAKALKESKKADIDFGGVFKAAVFLGASGIAVGLIVLNPFAEMTGSAPSGITLPGLPKGIVGKPIGSRQVESAPAAVSASDEARAKIVAIQKQRTAAKKAERENKASEEKDSKTTAARALQPKGKKGAVAEADSSYEALFKKTESAGPKTAKAEKVEKAKKVEAAIETRATLDEDEAKKLLEETRQAENKAAAAIKDEQVAKAAAAKADEKAAAEEKKAEQKELEANEKQDSKAAEKAVEERVKAEDAARAAEKVAKDDAAKAAEAEAKAEAKRDAFNAKEAEIKAKAAKEDAAKQLEAAVKKSEGEAAAKKAEAKAQEDGKAKAAEEAAKKAKDEAAKKVESKAEAPAPKPAAKKAPAPNGTPAPEPTPVVKSGIPSSGLGVVSGGESGGKVLPKEEVSDDVKNFLKTLKK